MSSIWETSILSSWSSRKDVANRWRASWGRAASTPDSEAPTPLAAISDLVGGEIPDRSGWSRRRDHQRSLLFLGGGYNCARLSAWRISTRTGHRAQWPSLHTPSPKSRVEVAAELREEREKRAVRSDLIAHFGGDADPAATMQALAGEILRVRHAMSQIVELITLATEGRDAVLVRACPMSPPMASASRS
jgi:hypothetical protein